MSERTSIFETLREKFLSGIKPEIDVFLAERKRIYEDIASSFPEAPNDAGKIKKRAENNRAILIKEEEFLKTDDIRNIFSGFIEFAISEANKSEELLITPQEEDLFVINRDDLITKRLRRRAKKVSRGFLRAVRFNKSYNFKRKIPLRNLYLQTLYTFIGGVLSEILEDIYKTSGGLYLDLYLKLRERDEKILNRLKGKNGAELSTSEDINSEKQNADLNIEEKFNDAVNKASEEFEQTWLKAGTFEHPQKKLSAARTEKLKSSLVNRNNKLSENFGVYVNGLFDRLNLLHDIMILNYTLLNDAEKISAEINKVFENKIFTRTNEIKSGLESIIARLEHVDGEKKEALESEKSNLFRSLNEGAIIGFIDTLNREDIAGKIRKLREEASAKAAELDKKYLLVKSGEMKFGIAGDKFKTFNPFLLFKEAVLPGYRNSLLKIEDEIKAQTGRAGREVIDISRIADYNLETALSLLDDEPGSGESGSVAKEGLGRAVTRTDETAHALDELRTKSIEAFKKETFKLAEESRELLFFEKLSTLKIEITREKTKRQVKENSREALRFILYLIPRIFKKLKEGYVFSSSYLMRFRKTIGLEEARTEVTEEIFDYLMDVEKSIKSLPRVYQRLFSIETLTDSRFFVGRKKNLDEIAGAFKRWDSAHAANIVITGEKGAGSSTLINFSLGPEMQKYPVLRTAFSNTIYREKDLTKFLAEFLEMPEGSGIKEIEDFLNSGEKKIIIAENIEDLFLRVVEGFEALEAFYELMTATNENIFWICTCNVYSWKYLDKADNVNDFFTRVISLQSLSDRETEQLIMKRHSLSGYKTVYLPSKQDEQSRSYRKASQEGKQEILKNNYFSSLADISRGNVALALLQWLRSVSSIEEQVIYIKPLKGIDFSFLKKMEAQKLFIIMGMLLHDGLTIEETSAIFRMYDDEARILLTALRDDGIVFQRNGRYKLNFLIYRNIVNILKDRNILH